MFSNRSNELPSSSSSEQHIEFIGIKSNLKWKEYKFCPHLSPIPLSYLCWERSTTSTNQRVDHRLIISKEYIFIDMRSFGETKSKAKRTYAQSGQYHTILESRES